jgi:hypothetical protein
MFCALCLHIAETVHGLREEKKHLVGELSELRVRVSLFQEQVLLLQRQNNDLLWQVDEKDRQLEASSSHLRYLEERQDLEAYASALGLERERLEDCNESLVRQLAETEAQVALLREQLEEQRNRVQQLPLSLWDPVNANGGDGGCDLRGPNHAGPDSRSSPSSSASSVSSGQASVATLEALSAVLPEIRALQDALKAERLVR